MNLCITLQLIYGFDNSIQFITLNKESLDQEKVKKFNLLGITIPSMTYVFVKSFRCCVILLFILCRQIIKREKLDFYLSSALGIPLEEDKLQDIEESQYVLTLDYTMKVRVGYL